MRDDTPADTVSAMIIQLRDIVETFTLLVTCMFVHVRSVPFNSQASGRQGSEMPLVAAIRGIFGNGSLNSAFHVLQVTRVACILPPSDPCVHHPVGVVSLGGEQRVAPRRKAMLCQAQHGISVCRP